MTRAASPTVGRLAAVVAAQLDTASAAAFATSHISWHTFPPAAVPPWPPGAAAPAAATAMCVSATALAISCRSINRWQYPLLRVTVATSHRSDDNGSVCAAVIATSHTRPTGGSRVVVATSCSLRYCRRRPLLKRQQTCACDRPWCRRAMRACCRPSSSAGSTFRVAATAAAAAAAAAADIQTGSLLNGFVVNR